MAKKTKKKAAKKTSKSKVKGKAKAAKTMRSRTNKSPLFIEAAGGYLPGDNLTQRFTTHTNRRGTRIQPETIRRWEARGWVTTKQTKEGRANVWEAIELTQKGYQAARA